MNDNIKVQEDVQVATIIDGSFTVSKAEYDRILNQVGEVVDGVNPSWTYTLEELCGKEFWENLSVGQRKIAGRCMADIVKKKLLPLVNVPGRCKHMTPKRYCLK